MFHSDGFLIRFLTKVCDVLFLNVIFVISCVTVIFSGTAVTSLYTVAIKMIRREDYEPVKGFLRAAKENFQPSVPATILLFADIMLIAVLHHILYADVLLISPTLFIALVIVVVILTALLSYLFPLLAHFENTFSRHLGNAARLALANLPVTILLTAVNLLPLLLRIFAPSILGLVAAFWLLFGFALGACLNSFYLNRIFGR